jgi:hypothetical protein
VFDNFHATIVIFSRRFPKKNTKLSSQARNTPNPTLGKRTNLTLFMDRSHGDALPKKSVSRLKQFQALASAIILPTKFKGPLKPVRFSMTRAVAVRRRRGPVW